MIYDPDETKCKITLKDCCHAGHCIPGLREWFKNHDLDFRDFVRNGITVSRLRSLKDGQSDDVIEHAYRNR